MAPVVTPPSPPIHYGQHLSTLSSLPKHIIQTQILPRLDFATLASLCCVSIRFHSVCSDQHLWRDTCSATWPSICNPALHQIISSFPSGYFSFFSNAFPLLHHTEADGSGPTYVPTRLISAVDIYYRGQAILSLIQEDTATSTRRFHSPVFFLYILDAMDTFVPAVAYDGDDDGFMDHLESCLTLSWIMIDPTRKLAVNLSSRSPVTVRPLGLGELELRYATVVGAGVKCEAVVTCDRRNGWGMHVRDMNLEMVDAEGSNLSGRASLVILGRVLEKGRREVGDGRERHREFVQLRRERRETTERLWRERRETTPTPRRRWTLGVLGISLIVLVASLLLSYLHRVG